MARGLNEPTPATRPGGALWRTVLGAGTPWQRRSAAIALVLGVIVVHGCIADRLAARMADLGAGARAMPPRIEVVYVREMEPAAPPVVAPPPPPPPRPQRRRAAVPHLPASAASAVVAEAPVVPEPVPQPVPEPPPEPPPPPAPAPAPEPVAAAASAPGPAASAAAFDWPASTRVSYVLTGTWRGELHGAAQVEWVRVDMHYQVHLDVRIGLPFAPLFTRRMTSDGRLTAEGLVPERYDEEQKRLGGETRRATIRFEPDALVMPDGQRRERWAGVQDQASQFVQLTYLFTLQPDLLTPGRAVEVPLALPRSVDRWVYDVVGPETLYTAFGAVDAVHLKPRRVSRPGGDLSAEIWFAPALAYLPVRIRIRQDAETWIDLMIERKPQLAAK
jgi:hypothetical protein